MTTRIKHESGRELVETTRSLIRIDWEDKDPIQSVISELKLSSDSQSLAEQIVALCESQIIKCRNRVDDRLIEMEKRITRLESAEKISGYLNYTLNILEKR